MNVNIKMPDLSTTEGSEITITQWLFEPGDTVNRGDPLLEVETDKATMEVESIVTGILKSTAVDPDDVVSVGDIIATIEVEGNAPAITPAAIAPETATAPEASAASPQHLIPKKKAGGMFAKNRDTTKPAGEPPPS